MMEVASHLRTGETAMADATHQPTITRSPVHSGYDELGSEDTFGEDYWLIIDGRNIGTTYYCTARYVANGERWASDGPAGLSMGHRTREDAEQAQIDAYMDDPTNVIDRTPTEPVPQPELKPLPMTWEQALAEAKEIGVRRCSNPALMASFCDGALQTVIGAVAPQLVWEGAQKKGLTAKELLHLCNTDVMAVSDLMWL